MAQISRTICCVKDTLKWSPISPKHQHIRANPYSPTCTWEVMECASYTVHCSLFGLCTSFAGSLDKPGMAELQHSQMYSTFSVAAEVVSYLIGIITLRINFIRSPTKSATKFCWSGWNFWMRVKPWHSLLSSQELCKGQIHSFHSWSYWAGSLFDQGDRTLKRMCRGMNNEFRAFAGIAEWTKQFSFLTGLGGFLLQIDYNDFCTAEEMFLVTQSRWYLTSVDGDHAVGFCFAAG